MISTPTVETAPVIFEEIQTECYEIEAPSSVFCDGWDHGYKEGYCYGQQFCNAPFPPLCPFPNFGEESYKDGYNRGFMRGMSDK